MNKDKVVKVANSEYEIDLLDYYIGVSGRGATTLYLPSSPPTGKQLIIKMEDAGNVGLGPATILCKDLFHSIDGEICFVLFRRNETLHIIFHNNNWNIVSNYTSG